MARENVLMILATPTRSVAFKKYFNATMLVQDILSTSSESNQQIEFFDLIATKTKKNPLLESIHAIPNGGNRNMIEATKMKREGVVSGVWDVCIPIPRFGYAGLYIEFKWTGNLSKEQRDFSELLSNTHCFAVCYSGTQAFELLKKWLSADNIKGLK